MSDKIEELLSPKRLRGRWQGATKKVAEAASDGEEIEAQSPLQILEKLKGLIEARFQGDDFFALNLLLEELEPLLKQRLPETGEGPKDQEVLDLAINETLNQIEDLVEAFELGGPGR